MPYEDMIFGPQPAPTLVADVAALKARIAELEAALRPFAEAHRAPYPATKGLALFVPREAWVRAAELVK